MVVALASPGNSFVGERLPASVIGALRHPQRVESKDSINITQSSIARYAGLKDMQVPVTVGRGFPRGAAPDGKA